MDERQQLNYIQWNERLAKEKPYVILSDIAGLPAEEKSNFVLSAGPEEIIHDVRGHEENFNINDHGFQFVKYDFSPVDTHDSKQVEGIYKPEVEAFLKEYIEGTDRVVFFDFRNRMNSGFSGVRKVDISSSDACLPPSNGVHLDQSPGGAVKRVRGLMGDKADYLLKGRVRIINVWRPLDYPVEDCPLAVSDGSKLQDQNLLVVDSVTKAYIGENVNPLYNKDAKWYYLRHQRPDEILILKIFDSSDSVKAKASPHTSFVQKLQVDGARPRKSCEIRALVFTYPTEKE